MSQITIQFPWFVLTEENGELLVVLADSVFMAAIFTDREFAELYNERIDGSCIVVEIPNIEEAIEFLTHVSTPTEDTDHVLHVCIDPVDPHGDEDVTAFEIDALLASLRSPIE